MRDSRGLFITVRPAIERFAEKCRFDPMTGCVLWTGGTTAGKGNSARYGSFWYAGSRWLAHRWSAIHIKGINLGENQGGHVCPCGPNTLCVEHIIGQTIAENVAEGNKRRKVVQLPTEKQAWLFISLGIENLPKTIIRPSEVPFYSPPEWFKPFMPKQEIGDDCPF